MDDTTFLAMLTMVFGFLAITVKMCYSSKCDQCNIGYGMIQIHRNISGEIEEDKVLHRTASNE
jgi:hypothetical protein